MMASSEFSTIAAMRWAASKAFFALVTSCPAASTPRTFPLISRYTEALQTTSVRVPSRRRTVIGKSVTDPWSNTCWKNSRALSGFVTYCA